jgi:hypothetical protein
MRPIASSLCFFVIVFLVTAPAGAATAGSPTPAVSVNVPTADDYVPGDILVGFRTDASARTDAIRGILHAEVLELFPEIHAERWRLPSGVSVADAIHVLHGLPEVLYAEPNYIWRAVGLPNDPLRNELYGMHNLGQTGGTPDADIDALEAWAVRTDASTVVVGVIDTGIDYNHEDLVGNIWTNPGEDLNANGVVDATDFNGIDDDGNGKIDDLRGWDCRNEDNDPMDDHNHGTHVAGTVGARGNNGVGVVGVSWSVKLMPLKFLSSGGSGTTTDAIECINYAASFVDASRNKIVRITSNSWGGGQKSKALEQAIATSGALFVAAAGNSGSSSKMYPAGYDLENIIAVAATDHNDNLASFSNFGTWVHLAAPGVSVLSSVRNNGYSRFSGTSMATPHVSGAAALVMAQFPAMTNAQVKSTILGTVDVKPSLQGKVASNGRLNVARAVGGTPDPGDPVPPAAVLDLTVDTMQTTQTTLTLAWTATGDDGSLGTAYLYDLRYLADMPITEANWDIATKASNEPIPQPSGSLETFTLIRLSPGTTYYLALRVADEAGGFSELSNVAAGATAPSPWEVRPVDGQAYGGDSALAYDPSGNPSVAYLDDTDGNGWGDALAFARWNGVSWDVEIVEVSSFGGSGGIDLAYDPADGNPSLSYFTYDNSMWATGTLKFAHRTGSGWTIQAITNRVFTNSETSLAYDPVDGFPSISFAKFPRGGSALKLAEWNGASWDVRIVTEDAARWHSLAFDPLGNPSLAYSDDIDGDGYLDTLKFARWDGTSWDFQIVETGVVGYGVLPDLVYDPVSGFPAIVHSYRGVRFAQWNGIAWKSQALDSGDGASLAFDAGGVPSVAYGASGEVRLAHWDGASWQTQVVEGGFSIGGQTHLVFDPSGRPSLSYAGASEDGSFRGVKYARKP